MLDGGRTQPVTVESRRSVPQALDAGGLPGRRAEGGPSTVTVLNGGLPAAAARSPQ